MGGEGAGEDGERGVSRLLERDLLRPWKLRSRSTLPSEESDRDLDLLRASES